MVSLVEFLASLIPPPKPPIWCMSEETLMGNLAREDECISCLMSVTIEKRSCFGSRSVCRELYEYRRDHES